MFNEQMNLEYQKLKQKREEAVQKFRLGVEKMESDEKREDLRTAADLQEAEMKHQDQVDKGFLELTKLAELSRRD
jgi:hypothetical protein